MRRTPCALAIHSYCFAVSAHIDMEMEERNVYEWDGHTPSPTDLYDKQEKLTIPATTVAAIKARSARQVRTALRGTSVIKFIHRFSDGFPRV